MHEIWRSEIPNLSIISISVYYISYWVVFTLTADVIRALIVEFKFKFKFKYLFQSGSGGESLWRK